MAHMTAAAPEAGLRPLGSVRVFLPLHQSTAVRRPVAFPNASPATWWLVVAAATGALAGGGATAAEGSATVAMGKLTLVTIAAVVKTKLIAVVAAFA